MSPFLTTEDLALQNEKTLQFLWKLQGFHGVGLAGFEPTTSTTPR